MVGVVGSWGREVCAHSSSRSKALQLRVWDSQGFVGFPRALGIDSSPQLTSLSTCRNKSGNSAT